VSGVVCVVCPFADDEKNLGGFSGYFPGCYCNRRSVVESDFYAKLKKLDVQAGKKDKLSADHVTQACEAQNRVIVSFLQQVQGDTRPTTEGSRENIGHNVHV